MSLSETVGSPLGLRRVDRRQASPVGVEAISRRLMTREYAACCVDGRKSALLIGAPQAVADRVGALLRLCLGEMAAIPDERASEVTACDSAFLFIDSLADAQRLTRTDIDRIRVRYGVRHVCGTILQAENRGKTRVRLFGADSYVVAPVTAADIAWTFLSSLGCERLTLRITGCDVPVEIDLAAMSVRVGERPVHLPIAEFKLLLVLTVLEKAVLSREELRDFLWPADTSIDVRSVDVLVTRLRHNLQSARVPLTVMSVRSAGYRMGRVRDGDCCVG
ncbi:winged helix-turn-helix domain-containing protein [Inquilinus sp. Marseille-Q2685]|uniref:winged helix-turn-helix domain-containing protein n=1 Tax=Inquilinus sp. Marseille-Q2685 TaxID=2866581 RepID=UPI001CE44F48|nr:winged helix-turn-helix domain-containing protein [Inquilinus sp. Marseille-Q2685]